MSIEFSPFLSIAARILQHTGENVFYARRSLTVKIKVSYQREND